MGAQFWLDSAPPRCVWANNSPPVLFQVEQTVQKGNYFSALYPGNPVPQDAEMGIDMKEFFKRTGSMLVKPFMYLRWCRAFNCVQQHKIIQKAVFEILLLQCPIFFYCFQNTNVHFLNLHVDWHRKSECGVRYRECGVRENLLSLQKKSMGWFSSAAPPLPY